MPGLTAYHGLLAVGRPRPGETVLVSAASGAVGAVVGQIAKMNGCRVIGTVGSDQKAEYCTDELGFDACINYKTEDVFARIAELAPDGIDIYFDNVGGTVTDAAIENLALRGRVIICGQISQYNLEEPEMAPAQPLGADYETGAYRGLLGVQLRAGPRGGAWEACCLGARRIVEVPRRYRGWFRGGTACFHRIDEWCQLRQAAGQDVGLRVLTATISSCLDDLHVSA